LLFSFYEVYGGRLSGAALPGATLCAGRRRRVARRGSAPCGNIFSGGDFFGRKLDIAKVNDVSIQVATVNGSGSQSANMVLMWSIFQMGVPVSGKNLFPSNIAGLPTWFTIRASKDGYIARKAEIDFVVALNPQTAKEDARAVQPGGALLADEASV